MLARSILGLSVLVFCLAGAAFAQQKPTAHAATGMRELPVYLRQNVTAGSTAVGTKVQAKLLLATLVDGTVIPADATLSGEVTESVARSATSPSQLGIRLDSAEWKGGSVQLKVFLTSWFYPRAMAVSQNIPGTPGGPEEGVTWRNWNGAGTYPDPSSPASHPFPQPSNDNITPGVIPDSSSSGLAKQRVAIKNVGTVRNNDGSLSLTSNRNNIKLDKSTAYVFEAPISAPAVPASR